MKHIELQSVSNVRDLGGIPVGSGRIVSPGLFFRGSSLDNIAPGDHAVLFDKLGIRCIVDVRCGWERENAPDISIPGIENLHIPFYDKDEVGIEYTEPAEGTKVVGRDVACDPYRFYYSLANPLTANQMRKGLACIFSHAQQGVPVYFHCSGGKDRAGILALLVLTVLGASRSDILEDYLVTNISRDKNYRAAFERFLKFSDGNEDRARELTEAHRARPENLDAFYQAVYVRYGGMERFVREKLAISDAQRDEIRLHCTQPGKHVRDAGLKAEAFCR